MRVFSSVVLVAAVSCALAACGSSNSSSSSPLSNELSYFPAGSPFVMSLVTDPDSPAVKQGQALKSAFPLAGVGQAAVTLRLEQLGINYDTDIRPLFGNPVMFGLAGSGYGAGLRNTFLAVWVTKDAGKLRALVKKLSSLLQPAGTHGSATLYRAGRATLAVDGATLTVASAQSVLEAALDRHANGGGITQTTYEQAIAGLPHDTLLEAFGSLSGVLSNPRAANARRIPWVAALKSYGAAITASSSGVTFEYRVDTTGRPLSTAQLPISGGAAPPNVAGQLPIVAALRDPHQTVAFIESAEQVSAPANYATFLRREATLRRKTGVDLNSLLALLTGNLIVQSNARTTMGRVGVSDPGAATRILSKLATQGRDVFAGTTTLGPGPAGFYLIKEPGKPAVDVGVVGNQLVVGRASPARLRAFAAALVSSAPGAQGAAAFRIALPELIRLALRRSQAPRQIAQAVLSKLGDVTGWTAATTSALTGTATLSVR